MREDLKPKQGTYLRIFLYGKRLKLNATFKFDFSSKTSSDFKPDLNDLFGY